MAATRIDHAYCNGSIGCDQDELSYCLQAGQQLQTIQEKLSLAATCNQWTSLWTPSEGHVTSIAWRFRRSSLNVTKMQCARWTSHQVLQHTSSTCVWQKHQANAHLSSLRCFWPLKTSKCFEAQCLLLHVLLPLNKNDVSYPSMQNFFIKNLFYSMICRKKTCSTVWFAGKKNLFYSMICRKRSISRCLKWSDKKGNIFGVKWHHTAFLGGQKSWRF